MSLKDGIPLMQIYRSGIYVSVAGGTKLSDGKWHTVRVRGCASQRKPLFRLFSRAAKLEVSNQGNFVVLEMDGSDKLVVGMRPAEPEEVLSGELRLALGGVLINSHHMMVPVSSP